MKVEIVLKDVYNYGGSLYEPTGEYRLPSQGECAVDNDDTISIATGD